MLEPSISEILSLVFGVAGVTLGFIDAEYYRQLYVEEQRQRQWLQLQMQLGKITENEK